MGQTSAKRTPKPKWLTLRVIPTTPNSVGRQTAAELRAYCRLNHIPMDGPVLAVQEYRVGPNPKGYCPSLASKPLPTYHLDDQIPLLYDDALVFWCVKPWEWSSPVTGERFRPEMLATVEAYDA